MLIVCVLLTPLTVVATSFGHGNVGRSHNPDTILILDNPVAGGAPRLIQIQSSTVSVIF